MPNAQYTRMLGLRGPAVGEELAEADDLPYVVCTLLLFPIF